MATAKLDYRKDHEKLRTMATEYHKIIKDVESKFRKANIPSTKFVRLLGELGKCAAPSLYPKYAGREKEIKAELDRVDKLADKYTDEWVAAKKALDNKLKRDRINLKCIGMAENEKYGHNFAYFNEQGKIKEGLLHTELDCISRKYRDYY